MGIALFVIVIPAPDVGRTLLLASNFQNKNMHTNMSVNDTK